MILTKLIYKNDITIQPKDLNLKKKVTEYIELVKLVYDIKIYLMA